VEIDFRLACGPIFPALSNYFVLREERWYAGHFSHHRGWISSSPDFFFH
jgi:hypothetical protein